MNSHLCPNGPRIIMVYTYRVFWHLNMYHNDTWTFGLIDEELLQRNTSDRLQNLRDDFDDYLRWVGLGFRI